jgi:protein-S-isoprenylcysteine O-methyltransferase Ste14
MFWLILSIVGWGILHSLTASIWFKGLLRRTFGDGLMRFYRLLYNILSLVSIALVLYLMLALPDRELYQIPAPWSVFMSIGQGLAALLLFVSLLQTDVLSFAGLRQLFEAEGPGSLVISGLYRLVRHPLYTFALLLLWLSPSVSLNSFIVYLSFTIYILVGIFFEERKLLREFGQAYAAYRSATPMLIPGLKSPGHR